MRRFEKYKPNGIAVSDLSSQLWCEKQLDLKLTTDIEPEVTEDIRRGKEKGTICYEVLNNFRG